MIMNENKDVIIQNLLDEKTSKDENKLVEMTGDEDLKTYNLLYSCLKENLEYDLSSSFKSSVIKRIEYEKKSADDTKFYCFFSIISFLGICVIGSMFYALKDSLLPTFAIIEKYKGFIITIFTIILLSYIMDKRFINTYNHN